MSQIQVEAAPLVPVLPGGSHPIQVQGLSHTFGEGETSSQVLIDTNLEIGSGEIVIMLGPSGSGKTTLLTLIGALRTVQKGSLKVFGQELQGMTTSELVQFRRNIGFIFQSHNLLQSLTATQNVQMALELKEPNPDRRRERAVEVLTALGLWDRLNHKPAQLSGGQRQRVAIARALANRPRLVLADEPTAALDAASVDTVIKQLQNLVQAPHPEDRSTILVVTHDEKLLSMADRVVTMKHGRIVSNVLRVDADKIVDFLKRCYPFSKVQLTDQTLRRIAQRMGWERFARGDTVIKEGEEADRFYLIWQGAVRIILSNPPPHRPKEKRLSVGQVFGEIALLRDVRRTATVVAETDLEVYSMSKMAFEATLAEFPNFRQELEKLTRLRLDPSYEEGQS